MRPEPRRLERLLPLLAALAGTAVTLRTMLASGLAMVPGNLEDARFEAFVLEHSWLWLRRDPLHRGLWDLPVFWPAGGGALAFSDAMVSFGPLYWPWRALVLAPDTSYQLWLAAIFVASALAVHWALRRVGASTAAAAAGAWLATFSASRLHHVSHPQLLPLFFVALAFGCAAEWARAEAPRRRRLALAGAAAAVVAQLYGGFYLGALALLALAALLLVALVLPGSRAAALPRLRADAGLALALVAGGALALAPWLRHYASAHAATGGRSWEEVAPLVPVPASWLYVTPKALAYGWVDGAAPFAPLAARFEHAIGLGFLTTSLLVAAVVASRHRLATRVVVGALAVLVLLTTRWPGDVAAWRPLVEWLPPLGALRAVVRVGLLLPLAAGLVLALALDASRGRRWRPLALVLAGLALAEQVSLVEHHDKHVQRRWVRELAARVDPAADAFLATRTATRPRPVVLHLDAAWATTLAGVPTVNGYSGTSPPGWAPLHRQRRRGPAGGGELPPELRDWLVSRGSQAARVQWIVLPASYRAGDDGLVQPRRSSGGRLQVPLPR